jgi:hypothetical protein
MFSCIAQTDLELGILLPQFPQYWNYRHTLPCLDFYVFLFRSCDVTMLPIPACQGSYLAQLLYKDFLSSLFSEHTIVCVHKHTEQQQVKNEK